MATRVTLFHNPTAGLENHSKEELLQALHEKGYQTTYVDTKSDDYAEMLKEPGELVVIAGGDGTVAKIVKHLLHKDIPIGLLPLGTANNIANSLGIAGEAADIIAGWDLSKKKPFDVGLVNGPDGESIFFESAGFGIFPQLISQHSKDRDEKKSREEELESALQHVQEILHNTEAHFCTLHMEEEQLSGDYLLVEIMNIRLAGPNMDLAPEADPGDGLLDVVLVREDERDKLEAYIANRLRGKGNTEEWQVRRAKELQVEWSSKSYHVDDEVHESEAPISVGIRIIPDELEFLVP
ncbi:diacylglycerol kinase [Pontibacter diazotrophicus]|uniref:Diacylglycerol kinase n=1 Tax=Pontibacter diazotrophicus TaxID=1400979 RepID=A0A3D8LA65_9BACT|nr:diacylglycerol kinase family protein [Pontibacter diazotrophicus]RDV14224.1 diacylglycerol kinase [Pontibacter diazotrophicus]